MFIEQARIRHVFNEAPLMDPMQIAHHLAWLDRLNRFENVARVSGDFDLRPASLRQGHIAVFDGSGKGTSRL
jgi:hypothetical protein